MICPYCKKEAKFCSNAEVYGKRFGKSHMCYWCVFCDAYVGTHNNTAKPLGTMANRALRKMRQHVHGAIDPLWKSGKYTRGEVYKRLSDAFGHEIHVGESDIEKCKEICRTVQRIFNLSTPLTSK